MRQVINRFDSQEEQGLTVLLQGALHYGSDIVEVSADIVIPTCSVGLPQNSYSTYTSDGWVGLSAYGYKGLIQTGKHPSIPVIFRNEA